MNKLASLKIWLGIFVLIAGLTARAHANAPDAEQYIASLGQKVLEVLKDTPEEKKRLFGLKEVFDDAIDAEKVGRFVLGKYWRQASEEQRAEFLILYKDYLLLNYIPHFKNYSGETFEVASVRDDGDGEYYVKTTILRPTGGAPLEVSYRVLRREPAAELKIFDIIAEGVSAITTHRSEFSSAISRHGLGAFLEKLKAHVEARR